MASGLYVFMRERRAELVAHHAAAADGPLDMRMGDAGPTAADVVNAMEVAQLAQIIAVLAMGLILGSGAAVAQDEGKKTGDYPDEVTLFKNVNIFDGKSEKLLKGYDVLVVENKIREILAS